MISIQVQVDTRAVERLLREAPGRLHQAMLRGMRRGSEVVVKGAQLKLKANQSIVSATLSNSIGYVLDEDALESRIGPGLKPRPSLRGDPRNYGAFVETGRGPGRGPKPEAIEWWVRKKIARKDSKRAAFLISRAIARKGTRPHPYLLPALVEGEPQVHAAFAAEIDREIRRLNEGKR